MLPTVSVTVIGLVVGLVVMTDRQIGWAPLAGGVIGAWVGFGLGTLAGIVVDVSTGAGIWVAIVGHGMALVIGWLAAQRASALARGGIKS